MPVDIYIVNTAGHTGTSEAPMQVQCRFKDAVGMTWYFDGTITLKIQAI